MSIQSHIPPQYYCFSCLSYQIYPHNNTVSIEYLIRYTPTILLFLFPFLPNIPPQYNCFCCLSYAIDIPPKCYFFCCLSYQIHPHNITLSVSYPIIYIPTILLFPLPVLSDIPPKYYCYFFLSYQIYPHNITVSVACAVKSNSTAHWCLVHKGNFILYSVVLWNNLDYDWALLWSIWRKVYRLHTFMSVSLLCMYQIPECLYEKFFSEKLKYSQTHKHHLCTLNLE